MPNRLIKESIHSSEKVNAMTDFQFRLWVNLITYVDDYGRGDARPAIIKGTCFPLRERLTNKDIEAALTGLAGIGCVGLYEVDGKPYLYFPNWEKHQSIRNKRSKFPAPEDGLQTIASNCKQMQANVPVIQSESNPNPNPNPIKAQERPADPLEQALDEFAKARKAMRKPLTEAARALTLRELEKLAPGDKAKQIAIINQSIQRGWQGVFPLKDNLPARPKCHMPMPDYRPELKQGDDLDRLEKMVGVEQ